MPRSAPPSQLKVILIFTAVYTLAAALFSLLADNFEFIYYIGVMLLLIGGLWLVHRRVGLSNGLLWCLSIWGLLHMAGGLIPVPATWLQEAEPGVLYNFWLIPKMLKYDQVIHTFGFGVTTWLCWQALSAHTLDEKGRPLQATPGLLILCAAAGIGFGALNEVIEFVATLILPDTNVGGYENTAWDLVANLVGAAGVGLMLYFRRNRTG